MTAWKRSPSWGDIEHRYAETICLDCIIRVSSFPDDDDPRASYIDIQLISTHHPETTTV